MFENLKKSVTSPKGVALLVCMLLLSLCVTVLFFHNQSDKNERAKKYALIYSYTDEEAKAYAAAEAGKLVPHDETLVDDDGVEWESFSPKRSIAYGKAYEEAKARFIKSAKEKALAGVGEKTDFSDAKLACIGAFILGVFSFLLALACSMIRDVVDDRSVKFVMAMLMVPPGAVAMLSVIPFVGGAIFIVLNSIASLAGIL